MSNSSKGRLNSAFSFVPKINILYNKNRIQKGSDKNEFRKF